MIKQESIGLFLGTFDPIHEGHTKIAKEILSLQAIDKVLIVPLLDAPHKETITASPKDRLAMCRLAIDDPAILVSDTVIKRNITGYDMAMIHAFKDDYHDAKLFYIMGSDVFKYILSWDQIDELQVQVNFIVVIRDPEDKPLIEDIMSKLVSDCLLIDLDMPPISSTGIREQLKKGQDTGISSSVIAYIKEHKIY